MAGGPGPDQRRCQGRQRDEPERGHVGKHAEVLEPGRGQYDGAG
jgi:hypothetical protein